MRKITTLLFIGLFTLSLSAQTKEKTEQTEDPNAPKFEFVSEVIDYGKIEQKSNGIRVFKFKNVGKTPLIINKITSSCGCTVPKKPTEPIMPNKTGEIEVKYDTNRPGGFSKTITIFSNASEPVKRVRIKGIVLKPEAVDKTTSSLK